MGRVWSVRYRYDRPTKKRYKTAEIIVEEVAWTPTYSADTRVVLKIAQTERLLQKQLRGAGAQWNPRLLLWELPYATVVALQLTDRVLASVEELTA